jgi:uncharacterized membrane protein YjjP (DUF1212 family)
MIKKEDSFIICVIHKATVNYHQIILANFIFGDVVHHKLNL